MSGPNSSSPDVIHALDQATGGTSVLAALLGAYYRQLLSERFNPDQAMTLVLDYQQAMLHNSMHHNDSREDWEKE